MDKMIKYCKMDVILLEKVHKALNNHIEAKTHYGVRFGQYKGTCPECGSDDIISYGSRISATGVKKIRYQCNTCHKYHQKTDK